MERWNELIAGHVLGNLTDAEQQELSAVLAKNPQLTSEIDRLRQTATLQSGQKHTPELPTGAEGWADMAVTEPPEVAPPLPSPKPIGRVPFQRAPSEKRFDTIRLWHWMALLLIVATGVDNWRLRRALAIAQERILQLESTAELLLESTE